MKKIILYGCGLASVEMRRNIEFFLDGNYEIVGCIDGKYDHDAIDNRKFFSFEELHAVDFDFIVLCSKKEETIIKMLERVQDSGIDRKRVLTPLLFMEKSNERWHLDLINNINTCYSGEKNLILGMSYSYTDLILNKLRESFYRCCCLGMDLYYSFEVYKYIMAKKLTNKVNTVMLIFAYDHFHYDMSRSRLQYRSGNIFSLWRLDDWHNSEYCADAWEYIENYRLFAKRVSGFYHFEQFDCQNEGYYYSIPDGEGSLMNIWFRKHEETVIENVEILKEFIIQIKRDGASPVIVIPPYYLRGLDELSKNAFKEKREEFYQILHELEVEIGKVTLFDYSNLFAQQREYFTD